MVGHYRIVKKIGTGGMGDVYHAEDTKLNRQVALKFLASNLVSENIFRARFIREAQATAALDHPNVITIHEVSEYKGRPFFAMQLVEGKTLSTMIRDKQLQISEVIDLATQICKGLRAAHKRGIIHRDVKPSNILVDSVGQVKVLDFGIAKVIGDKSLTETGTTVGTYGYMSPEHVQGKELDQRSDLFSFGIVLYEMITGLKPFIGKHEAEILHRLLNEEPKHLVSVRPDTPNLLHSIVLKMLSKNPTNRYQDATEILNDLRQLELEAQPTTQKTFIRLSERFLNIRWIIITTSILLIALVSLSIFQFPNRQGQSVVEAKPLEQFRVAVLSFDNLSGDEETDVLCHSFSKGLYAKLKYNSKLTLLIPESFEKLVDIVERRNLLRELNVDFAIEGHINRIGSALEVGYQLYDVIKDRVVSQATFTVDDTKNLFQTQGSILEAITRKLGMSSPSIAINPFGYESLELDTQELLRKGEFLLDKDEPEAALTVFKQAKQSEPERLIIDYYIGQAFKALGDHSQAIDHLKLSLTESLHEKNVRTLFRNDSLFLKLISTKEGIAIYQKRWSVQPNVDSLQFTCYDYIRHKQIWTRVVPGLSNPFFFDLTNPEEGHMHFGPPQALGDNPVGSIKGINGKTGEVIWKVSDTIPINEKRFYQKFVDTLDDVIFSQDKSRGRARFIDQATGEIILERDINSAPRFQTVDRFNLVESTLVVEFRYRDTSSIAGFNINTGTESWTISVPWRGFSIRDSISACYYDTATHAVTLINLHTGEPLWHYRIAASDTGRYATRIWPFGEDLVVINRNRVMRLNPERGLFQRTKRWEQQFDCENVYPISYQALHGRPATIWLRARPGSTLWKIDLESGRILKHLNFSILFPIEGNALSDTSNALKQVRISNVGDTLLFHKDRIALLYDARQMKTLAQFSNPTEQDYLWFGGNVELTGRYILFIGFLKVHMFDIENNNKILLYKVPSSKPWHSIFKVHLSAIDSLCIIAYNGVTVIHLPEELSSGSILAQQIYRDIADSYIKLGDEENAFRYLNVILDDYNPLDAEASFMQFVLASQTNKQNQAIQVLQKAWDVIAEKPEWKDSVVALLKSRFGLAWMTEMDMMPKGPHMIRFDTSKSDTSFMVMHRVSRGVQVKKVDRRDGATLWSTEILSKPGHNSDMYWQRIGTNWIIAANDRSQDSILKCFYGIDTIGNMVWACTLKFARSEGYNINLRSWYGTDSLLEIILEQRDYRTDKASSYYVSINPVDGTILSNLRLPEVQPALYSLWRLTPSFLVNHAVGVSRLLSARRDSLTIYSKPDLSILYKFSPDNPINDYRIVDDTLMIYTQPPNRYALLDLRTFQEISFVERDFVGKSYSPGIIPLGDSIFFDYDSSHYFAFKINSTSDRPLSLMWEIPYRELLGENISPVAIVEDKLFLITESQNLVAVSLQDGRFLGQTSLLWAGWETSWKQIRIDGEKIYLITDEGILYALKYDLDKSS